jgi:histidine triad (HIT) family protein
MINCLFCKIVAQEIPSDKVLENSDFLAFRDIDPKAPVHVLVIPKKHFEDIVELSKSDNELSAGLMKFATEVAEVEKLKKGFRIVLNTGQDGGQSVQHVHVHVLGGRSLIWPPG